MTHTILSGGGWFVSCIMIYYVVLWFIRRFFIDKIIWVFLLTTMITVVWYIFYGTASWDANIYGETYLKWVFYFMFMLLGAFVGLKRTTNGESSNSKMGVGLLKLIGCVIMFYLLCTFKGIEDFVWVQLFSLLPLLGVAYYSYVLCNSQFLKDCYTRRRIVSPVMKLISGLCLEIYLVQCALLHVDWLIEWLKPLFPLNIILFLCCVFATAYVLRCLSRIFSQTFGEREYDWKEIVRMY